MANMLRDSWDLDIKNGIVQNETAVLLDEWGLSDLKEAADESKFDDPSTWQQIPDETLSGDLGMNQQQIEKWKIGLEQYDEVRPSICFFDGNTYSLAFCPLIFRRDIVARNGLISG